MKVVIVIPTYNEEDNISRLLPALEEEFQKIENNECHVLIVDGNSTDRTQEVVLGYSNTHPWVHLLVEKEKSGLGGAYLKGYQKAIHELGAEAVMEMDADFQHDPKDIKRLLAEIDKGADFVIGSRYLSEGGIPKEWEAYRRFLSWGGNIFAKVVLGVPLTEFTTSFRATRVKGVLDQLDLTSFLSTGFAYKLDLIYRVYKTGAKMVEIPINFGLRDRGDSKMEGNNLFDSMRVVLTLRFRESTSFLRVATVGALGAVIDFTFANFLRVAGLEAGVAATVAIAIAMVFNFALNNIWSFNAKKITGAAPVIKKFVPFVFLSLLPVIFRFFFVTFVVTSVSAGYLAYNLAIAFSIGLGLLWNYYVYSRVIWKEAPAVVKESPAEESKN